MFCFLSHIIEDCYFDVIEMFFFVVGHTHNILDQWFGVLARAIRKANFIGTVLALHAIYKTAHADKVEHLRPKEVHQIEIYHDFRKYYSPLINEEIHHFNIPLRWRLQRDPLLGVSTAQYQVVSPTAGLSHLETWQPITTRLADSDDTGCVELSLFMSYNGPDSLYNALGINTSKHTTSVELLTDVARKTKKTAGNVADIADVLPLIRQIEVRAIAETEKRMAAEADGIYKESAELTKEFIKSIDKEITAANSSKGGRIVWLRRSKISDNPNYLARRPDILPNPELWFNNIATDTAKRKLAEDDARKANLSPPKIKTDPEATLAQSRLIAFQRGATEIATTCSQILKMIPSQIDVDEGTTNIKKATSGFRKPVLTKREVDWLTSLSTSNIILQRQKALVKAELSKPWEIINIPIETSEQKLWREKVIAERATVAAQVEARLRKLLHRVGEGEYDPNLQVVTMDGFNAATTSDIAEMRRPQMEQLAKGHIPDYKKLKVDALRAALKAYMTANPGAIQLPGEAPINTIPSASSSSMVVMPTSPSAAVAASTLGSDDCVIETGEHAGTMDEQAVTTSSCAVMECEVEATEWCERCQLSFCKYLHGLHNSHAMQTKRDGISASKSDWTEDVLASRMAAAASNMILDASSKSKKRKNSMESLNSSAVNLTQGTDPSTILSCTRLNMIVSKKSKARKQITEELKPAAVSNTHVDVQEERETTLEPPSTSIPSVPASSVHTTLFRLEGDNQDKRIELENQKLSDAIDYINSLQCAKELNYIVLYQKFRYENFYDTSFLCSLANSLYIDVSEVTHKKRYSHKELLNCFINKLI